MGYNISTIRNIPLESDYYFFLVGKRGMGGKIADALYLRFDEIAERIGSDSALVKTPNSDKVYEELTEAFLNAKWFRTLYNYALMKEPALVIMNRHPSRFNFNNNEYFALIPFSTLEEIYGMPDDLIRDMIRLSVEGVDLITPRLSSVETDNSLWNRVKQALLLQPNVNGIGIDLNVLFYKPHKDELHTKFEKYILSKEKGKE